MQILSTIGALLIWFVEFYGRKSLCTGQKIEKKLAKETKKGFHRKLPHNQRNPYEPD